MALPDFKDFDPSQKPPPRLVPRFVSDNTGLVCLLGLLLFPVVVGFSFGYLLVVLAVSAFRKVRGEKSRQQAADEASQKIQVVLGDSIVDSSFPNTVSLNVQQDQNRPDTNARTKYYYHRLSSQSDGSSSGRGASNFDSASDGEAAQPACDVTESLQNGSSSSTHASLEDNIDKTEDESENASSRKRGRKEEGRQAGRKICSGPNDAENVTRQSRSAQGEPGNGASGRQQLVKAERVDAIDEEDVQSCKAIPLEEVDSDGEKPPSPVLSEGKFGRLRFALHYNLAKNELQVNIIKATELRVGSNANGVNPFVKICLLPQQFCWQRTKVIEGTRDPVFNETFIISGFSKDRMKEYALQFRVINYRDWFYDRYGDDVIGEIHFPLSEVKRVGNRPSFSLTKWMNLQPLASFKEGPGSLGEICVSLCFRPISGRLIITITRIRGLPKAADGRTDPYVKIALYCEGVRLSKANTRVKRRSTNPVYNEKFNFNVSAEEISLTTVVLKIANHCQAASGAASLGMLVLGFDSFGSGQEHWNSMLESPSRHTEKWHKLHADSTSI